MEGARRPLNPGKENTYCSNPAALPRPFGKGTVTNGNFTILA
jgi:hypothetical protein